MTRAFENIQFCLTATFLNGRRAVSSRYDKKSYRFIYIPMAPRDASVVSKLRDYFLTKSLSISTWGTRLIWPLHNQELKPILPLTHVPNEDRSRMISWKMQRIPASSSSSLLWVTTIIWAKQTKRKKDKPEIYIYNFTTSMSLFFCRMIFIVEELERF